MTLPQLAELTAVVDRVKSWPPPLRIALARRILETLEGPPAGEPPATLPRGPSAAEVAAMFATGRPAPDDATVKQWIEEYRMGKYGQ